MTTPDSPKSRIDDVYEFFREGRQVIDVTTERNGNADTEGTIIAVRENEVDIQLVTGETRSALAEHVFPKQEWGMNFIGYITPLVVVYKNDKSEEHYQSIFRAARERIKHCSSIPKTWSEIENIIDESRPAVLTERLRREILK